MKELAFWTTASGIFNEVYGWISSLMYVSWPCLRILCDEAYFIFYPVYLTGHQRFFLIGR